VSETTGNGNDPSVTIAAAEPPRRRSSLPILILAVLFVVATFLTWYFTWFGRELSDADISKYLADEKHPRHVQHALLRIQDRMEKGSPGARQWYPRLLELSGNPETEYRLTVAWVMGFDNKSEEFHQALLKLLKDAEPIVRRNAALALIRFNDARGRAELLATLEPYPVVAAAEGVVSSTLNEGSPISRGTLLARIAPVDNKSVELRAPLSGKIEKVVAPNGSKVGVGDTVLTITSDEESVWEVLRGLSLIGEGEDLPEIERYARGVGSLPDRIKQQAALTAKIIRARLNQKENSKQ
jgi:hypothetical protein